MLVESVDGVGVVGSLPVCNPDGIREVWRHWGSGADCCKSRIRFDHGEWVGDRSSTGSKVAPCRVVEPAGFVVTMSPRFRDDFQPIDRLVDERHSDSGFRCWLRFLTMEAGVVSIGMGPKRTVGEGLILEHRQRRAGGGVYQPKGPGRQQEKANGWFLLV